MNIFLAMSCLQGRPMHAAFDELVGLGPAGIQLTPGNAPTAGFDDHVRASHVAIRTHHGFSLEAIRAIVWSADHRLLGDWDSVHPPREAAADWLPSSDQSTTFETMYPGYPLGSGIAIDAAMAAEYALAVDVSHVHIQIEQGVMSASTWRRLQRYERITEIHVSANDGRRDQHRPLTRDTFGLDWARDRSAGSDLPVVLECYMHHLSPEERRSQLSLVRGDQ